MLAYLDCFSGISGDMLLGALLHAGLDLDELRAGLATLPLSGYTLEAERVSDHGLSGVRCVVRVKEPDPHEHRHLREIRDILAAGRLPNGRASERWRSLRGWRRPKARFMASLQKRLASTRSAR